MRPGSKRLLTLIASACLFLTACATPAAGPPSDEPAPQPAAGFRFIEWAEAKDGAPKTYHTRGLALTADRGETADGEPAPVLTISDGTAPAFRLVGAETFPKTYVLNFGAFDLDRKVPGPQVLMYSFTFGAHCCFRYELAARIDGEWRRFGLGDWDGDGMPMPRDVDGDGRLELLAGDQAFLYTFDSYAGSDAPAKVFEVVDGELADVSKDPRYRPAYEADAARQKSGCEDGFPGVCAAYAASLARLGRIEDAWPLIARAKPGQGGADPKEPAIWLPDGKRRVFTTFRESLEWFLADQGYIPLTASTPRGRLVDARP